MALLKFENGNEEKDLSKISSALSDLGIKIDKWEIPQDNELRDLIGRETLNDDEKEAVLKGLDTYFEKLKSEKGYTSRDLIVLHPGLEGLEEMLKKFDRIHTHDDDEVRYIIDGAGVFGFVMPDSSQVTLTVEAEEFINVPKGTEHWFVLTPERRTKAVRYFSGTEGWVPNYTNKETRL